MDGSYNVATGEYGAGVAFFSEQGEEHISRKGEDKELASMRNVAGEILGSRLAMEKAVALKQKKIRPLFRGGLAILPDMTVLALYLAVKLRIVILAAK